MVSSNSETNENLQKANALKEEGNEFIKASKFNEAIEKYSEAIKLHREPVFFCNRAAAYCRLEQYDLAIEDCCHSLALDETYAKAYGRMGTARACQGRYVEAIEAYKKALELDPENETYKNNLAIAEEKIHEAGSSNSGGNPVGGLGGLGSMLGGGMPDLGSLMNNPQMMQAAMQMMNDPNMRNLMGSMMEQYMGGAAGGGAGGGASVNDFFAAGQNMAQQMRHTNPEVVEQLRQQFSAATTEDTTNEQQRPSNPETRERNNVTFLEDDHLELVGEEKPSTEDIAKANALKEEGNECVKASKFNEAIEKYNQAIKLNPDPVYFCNRAAAYCRLEQYDLAIEDCCHSLALDETYAKAYGRMGIALTCQGRYVEAIEAYSKALELDPENENFKTNLAIAEEKNRETPNSAGGLGGLLGGGAGGLGSMFGGAGGAPGGMPDLGSLMNNPQYMEAATQMMNDTNMQNLMGSMMEQFMGGSAGGAGGGGFNDLLAAGQSMAQQMQQTNPELVELLRQQILRNPSEEGNQQNDDKDNDTDA